MAFAHCEQLTDVYCHTENVPAMKDEYGIYLSTNAFLNSYIEYATLHLPDASITHYQLTKPWNEFGKIVPLTSEETAIIQPKVTSGTDTKWHTLDGGKLNSKPTEKGIYIYNGRKVYVK